MFQFDELQQGHRRYEMRVHLVTVDVTNPYNSFSPYLSMDKYYVASRQSQDVQYRKDAGLKPVVSMMGSAFVQTNMTSAVRSANEVVGKVVADSEIKYEESWNSRTFYMDDLAHIGNLVFKATAVSGDSSYPITMVNHHRDHAGNNIALFCNGVPSSLSSPSTQSNGVDVRVRLKDCTKIGSGKTTCEVVEKMNGCGHAVGQGEAILSGVGDAATFLNAIMPGTEIVIDVNYIDENGASVALTQGIEKFFNFGIKEGKVIPADSKDYAICGIGCSKDGKTLYMADLEFSAKSDATVQMWLEFLQQLGIYNFLPLDGGPSAEMTIDGNFVTANAIPGFEGRFVPNGMILYSTAPDDPNVSFVECPKTASLNMKYGESFVPEIVAFNQYGEMLDSDAKQHSSVSVTCSPNIGYIDKDGYTFWANGVGRGSIDIDVPATGFKMSIPVEVVDSCELVLSPSYLFTEKDRGCQLSVKYRKNGVTVDVDPNDVIWYCSNYHVVKSWMNGNLQPDESGTALIEGCYEGVYGSMTVDVENHEEGVDYADVSHLIDYGDITDMHVPGIPTSLSLAVKVRRAGVATLKYTAGGSEYSISSGDLNANDVWNCHVVFDKSRLDAYPVTLKGITGSVSPTVQKVFTYYGDGVKGDIDANGFFELNDILLLMSMYLGETSYEINVADANGDGVFSISDITYLLDLYLRM